MGHVILDIYLTNNIIRSVCRPGQLLGFGQWSCLGKGARRGMNVSRAKAGDESKRGERDVGTGKKKGSGEEVGVWS